jgi:hypothetical protein
MSREKITQEQVKSILHYEEGELYWKDENGNKGEKVPIDYVDKDSYKRITIDGIRYRQHRVIFLYHHGYLPKQVDHEDENKTNNLISNLRDATNAQNSWNTGKISTNSSGYKGVYFDKKTKKWRGQVKCNEKKYSTKRYDTIEEAVKEIMQLREQLHGEFANHG